MHAVGVQQQNRATCAFQTLLLEKSAQGIEYFGNRRVPCDEFENLVFGQRELLMLFALRDIFRDPRYANHLPIAVANREGPILYPPRRSVRPDNPVLLAIGALHLPGPRAFHDPRTVFRMDGIVPGLGRRIEAVASLAPDFFVCGTYVEDLVLARIGQPKHFADALRKLPETIFAFAKSLVASQSGNDDARQVRGAIDQRQFRGVWSPNLPVINSERAEDLPLVGKNRRGPARP